jgi:diphosphomevalonate decarboxylase
MGNGLHEKYIKESLSGVPGRLTPLRSAWRSPSNIALVKYWGKAAGQIPRNPSLSFSLQKSVTEMRVTATPAPGAGFSMEYLFEGKPNPEFGSRVEKYLRSLLSYFPFLGQFSLEINSRNTFPHSSGIASSASSMSALALCLCSLEEQVPGGEDTPVPDKHTGRGKHRGKINLIGKAGLSGPELPSGRLRGMEFFQKASYMARLGSGSASRSVYGGFATWGTIDGGEEGSFEERITSDEFATPLGKKIGKPFRSLHDAVLIVSPHKKKVSSSQGHALMDSHPFAGERYRQSNRNIGRLLTALEKGDVESFIRITENEALTLHGLMMSSDPGFMLLEPATLEILSRIRAFREKAGTFVAFTIDAGPNVHLIYPSTARKEVLPFIRDELSRFCCEGNWIDDQIGEGPLEINH